jgi:menaquinone-dependent protoporphyrinogen oxidase
MTSVLVTYGSRHGGTQEIAERIGEVLRADGLEATVAPAADVPSVRNEDAVVIGSGVYMGSWLAEPLEFMERNGVALAARPVWLFSSGPLPGSSKSRTEADPLTDALGPTEGPGSGGRRKVEALSSAIHPRDHHVFFGRFDPADPPRAFSERIVRLMPASKDMLPAGDFRDWTDVETWARGIAATLQSPVTVG